jgi:hypothetical protein
MLRWEMIGRVLLRINKEDGAQGRNRTTDTCIFSAVLYRLSYLGTAAARAASL